MVRHYNVQGPRHATMSWYQNGAIFASTARPNKAKLFMSWIVGKESQKLLVREGFRTPQIYMSMNCTRIIRLK